MATKLIPLVLVWLLVLCTSWHCTAPPPVTPVKVQQKTPLASGKWGAEIIPAPENTFGYDIYEDGRLLVHQPNIPALPGNLGFKTQDQALRAAALMIKKLEAGVMPPTVTTEEIMKIVNGEL